MAMSVLFGHKKGAYTGATENREGLLKTADNGILFLDEIGELGLDEQAMLLRAVEEKLYLPVGSDKEVRSNFQLITGTNRNLKQECRNGRFRQDLLARIKFWEFDLPGLKERPEDVEPNIDYELQLHSKSLGKPVGFSSEARKAYIKFARSQEAYWVANFRDLNSSVARMITLSDGNRIGLADVELEIERLRREWRHDTSSDRESHLDRLLSPEKLADLDLFDSLQLNAILSVCKSAANMAEAGRTLFAGSLRKKGSHNDSDRLRKYLQRFGVNWQDIKT
jgi:transcriptional regulatory protein RtcR